METAAAVNGRPPSAPLGRRLPTAVADHHRRIDPPGRVLVVGDVHGCLDALDRLLERLDPAPADRVVFVGDLVRKGPDSAGVIERVRSHPSCLSVRGNNEQKLLDDDASIGLSDDDRRYLASLPLVVSWPGHLVVHGGIRADRPLSAHTATDLLTTRSRSGDYESPYWFEEYDGPERVYFGHTVLRRPVTRPHAVGLDTGCVYGGHLSAIDVTTDTVYRVNGTEHLSRSDDAVATPTESAS